jgi:hypothetical protein
MPHLYVLLCLLNARFIAVQVPQRIHYGLSLESLTENSHLAKVVVVVVVVALMV